LIVEKSAQQRVAQIFYYQLKAGARYAHPLTTQTQNKNTIVCLSTTYCFCL